MGTHPGNLLKTARPETGCRPPSDAAVKPPTFGEVGLIVFFDPAFVFGHCAGGATGAGYFPSVIRAIRLESPVHARQSIHLPEAGRAEFPFAVAVAPHGRLSLRSVKYSRARPLHYVARLQADRASRAGHERLQESGFDPCEHPTDFSNRIRILSHSNPFSTSVRRG